MVAKCWSCNQAPKKHNGWANYETWLVWSVLSNEDSLYEQFIAICQNPDSLYERAEQVQEWLRIDRNAEEHDIELTGSFVDMYTSLVCSALDSVDWYEIVQQVEDDMKADRW